MKDDLLADEAEEIAKLEKAPEPAKADAQPVEQEPAPEPEEAERDNEGQFVRKGDFKALRQQAEAEKAARREIEARYASDMAKLQSRLDMIAQAQAQAAQPKPEAPKIPNLEEDPIGHFQAKQAELERQVQEAQQFQKQTLAQTEQQRALQQIGAEVSRLEQEFEQQTPDYRQAQQHLFNTWQQEAQLLGVPADEAVRFWSMQIVQRAAQQNKNPAQVAYELARQRGYAGAQRQTQQPQGPNLDTIQKGVAASKSTSSAPGKPTAGTPTIEALLAMDDDDFAKAYGSRDSSTWSRDVEKAMGLR